jgi:mono/diheme cytochrome c family protein
MSGRGIRLGLGLLAFAFAGSAAAQGNLDQGKTAAQLYASACATCHKSPPSLSNTRWFFGLESFLREHYTSSRESAAILAAYLKEQEKALADSQRGRLARHTGQTRRDESRTMEFGEAIPRPPADIPDVRR